MTVTRSLSLLLLSTGFVLAGLAGCSSKSDVFQIKEQDDRWFCTPESEEEWRCQESDNEFQQIAERRSAEKKSKEQSTALDTVEVPSQATEAEAQVSGTQEPGTQELVEQKPPAKQETPVEDLFVKEPVGVETEIDNKSPEETTATVESPEEALTPELEPKPDSDVGAETVATASDERSELSWWVVQLGAYSSQAAADALIGRLEQGQLFETEVGGKRYFTVVAVGFDNQSEAEQFASEVQSRHPDVSPWVRSGASLKKVLLP